MADHAVSAGMVVIRDHNGETFAIPGEVVQRARISPERAAELTAELESDVSGYAATIVAAPIGLVEVPRDTLERFKVQATAPDSGPAPAVFQAQAGGSAGSPSNSGQKLTDYDAALMRKLGLQPPTEQDEVNGYAVRVVGNPWINGSMTATMCSCPYHDDSDTDE